MDNFKKNAKEYGKRGWEFLKEILQRIWVVIKRAWKKYHITKVGILLVLTAGLLLSIFLTVQARQVDVDRLQVGLQEPTTILDDQGEVAGTLYAEKGTYTPIEAISPTIQQGVIATEDQRFMRHRGFDLIGIGRAAFGYITEGHIVGGGSTITQQLAKNAYLTADQTLLRKLKELFLAIEIEKTYPKEEILEMYLNNSYFGQGVWGVQDASKKYFNKNASDLSISEGATLAGLLQSPSNTNPLDNYERAINRRDTVLMLMEEVEAITPEERQTAASSDLVLADGYYKDKNPYPAYFDAVVAEAKERYDFKETEILNGGYVIYTSLNQNQQQQMDQVYAQEWLFETAPDGTKSESASVAMNPKTGGVTAIVGGRDYSPGNWNRAIASDMKRQPGSTIKPLSVYAPALEAGYELDSILVDELTTYGADDAGENGDQYANVDHTYAGEVPMYEALGQSKNAATVWLLNEIGIDKGIRKLRQFGIPVDAEKERKLGSIALGGMEEGVNPLQMASAYSVFANDGVRIEPYFISKIVDPTGAVVVDNSKPKESRVLSTEVNDDMNRMLLYVFSNGNAQIAKPYGYEVAGKTGTTDRDTGEPGVNDQWIVGYTPDLVVASWAGYDNPNEYHLTNYASNGIGQVLKAELEAMIPYTENTQFAVDEEEIQVIVRDNRREETTEALRRGLKRTGEFLEDTTKKAINGARRLLESFSNR